MAREHWGSRFGVILAVAGSAVGLGNFIRFPVKAAQYGGGAFIIPYLVALLLLGLPLMWIEWTIGRYGGGFGHSTAPGMFHSMWNKNRFIKYFGVIGIFGPMAIFVFYIYIESWLLGYSYFALSGAYRDCTTLESMRAFLGGYQGQAGNTYFSGIGSAYFFFVVTFIVNAAILYLGVNKGIERLCKYAMPLLFALAVVLMIRVLALGTPVPAHPERNVVNGLGYLWNPKWRSLLNAKVWLEAAGQVFFTLSVGIGVILTYASYLKRDDDVALSGLTAASFNELAEVILGGSIVITAAVVFFGAQGAGEVAARGTFDLSFVTMPFILQQMPWGALFGFFWFFLLFLGGVTSSISLAQPAIAFMEDEFKVSKQWAVFLFAVVTFILTHACIFGPGVVLGELDFWGGTFALVLFATIETILFAWVFGMERAWTELHSGSDITIPRVYRFVIKYVTPVFLIVILTSWFWQEGLPVILMKGGVDKADVPYMIATRIGLLVLFTVLCVLVAVAWKRKRTAAVEPAASEGDVTL